MQFVGILQPMNGPQKLQDPASGLVHVLDMAEIKIQIL